MGGWGTGSWGTSPWGVGDTAILTLESAYPSTIRSVIVNLSLAPLAQSVLSEGDALNPNTWSLVRDDTDEAIAVYAARMVTSTSVELLLLDVLPSFGVLLTVSTETLLDSNGTLVNYPRSVTFPGLAAATNAKPRPEVVDLRSNQLPGEEFAASLVINTTGDYDLEGGTALLRKKILRRLTSTAGDWAHMPNYGAGLQVKTVVPLRELPSKAAELERQVELETEVDTASVSLTYTPTGDGGILTATVKVRTRKGEEFSFTFPDAEPGGVAL